MTATNTENYFVPRRLPLGSRKLIHCFQGYASLHTLSPPTSMLQIEIPFPKTL